MDVKDHEAIAGIVRQTQFLALHPSKATLVDALGDYMEAEYTPHPGWACDERCEGQTTYHHFDRAAWIATCYGEPAHQDNATPGRT